MDLAVKMDFTEQASLKEIAQAEEVLATLFKHEPLETACVLDRDRETINVITDIQLEEPDLALVYRAHDYDGSLTLGLAHIIKTASARCLFIRIREFGNDLVTIGVRRWKPLLLVMAMVSLLSKCTTT